MTFARLRALWLRKSLLRWTDGSDPMWVRTYGRSRSQHGRTARRQKRIDQEDAALHRRVQRAMQQEVPRAQ